MDKKDSDHNAWTRRLIRFFVGRTFQGACSGLCVVVFFCFFFVVFFFFFFFSFSFLHFEKSENVYLDTLI